LPVLEMLLLVDTGQKRTIVSPNPTSVGVAICMYWCRCGVVCLYTIDSGIKGRSPYPLSVHMYLLPAY